MKTFKTCLMKLNTYCYYDARIIWEWKGALVIIFWERERNWNFLKAIQLGYHSILFCDNVNPCGMAWKDTFLAPVSGGQPGFGCSGLDRAGLGTKVLGSLCPVFWEQQPSGHDLLKETEEEQEGSPSAQTRLTPSSRHILKISLAAANPGKSRSSALRAWECGAVLPLSLVVNEGGERLTNNLPHLSIPVIRNRGAFFFFFLNQKREVEISKSQVGNFSL